MKFHRAVAAILVVVVASSPALGLQHVMDHHRPGRGSLGWQDLVFGRVPHKFHHRDHHKNKHRRGRHAYRNSSRRRGGPDLSAYEGLGSWIDIFNVRPWARPKRAVRTMAKRGAKTIFLQTSTYGQSGGIYDEEAVNAFLYHAHRRGMKVVAWYVPSFTQQKVDLQRALRAIRYRSPSGDRFDSFGLDIEATHVADISIRNSRLVALSKRIRRAAGRSYPLSAITPDPIASLYWPRFPWKETAQIYDVIVPMGYFTFRASGYDEVREYTSKNIKKIRRETKDRDVPIHFIGGIADDAGPVELKGFVKASREHRVIGASLYDYPITSRRSWYEMRALDPTVAQRRRLALRARHEAAAERARQKRKKRDEARKAAGRKKALRDRPVDNRNKNGSGRNRKANGRSRSRHP